MKKYPRFFAYRMKTFYRLNEDLKIFVKYDGDPDWYLTGWTLDSLKANVLVKRTSEQEVALLV